MRIPAIRPSVMLEVIMRCRPRRASAARTRRSREASRSASASPRSISSSSIRSNVEMCRSRIRTSASRTRDRRALVQPVRLDVGEAGLAQLRDELRLGREPREIDSLERRQIPVEPVRAEVRLVEGHDREAAVRPEDAPRLGERGGSIDEVEHQPEHGALEPAVLERERLRLRLLERDARKPFPSRRPASPATRRRPRPSRAPVRRARRSAGPCHSRCRARGVRAGPRRARRARRPPTSSRRRAGPRRSVRRADRSGR